MLQYCIQKLNEAIQELQEIISEVRRSGPALHIEKTLFGSYTGVKRKYAEVKRSYFRKLKKSKNG